jgi:hypothetical protein
MEPIIADIRDIAKRLAAKEGCANLAEREFLPHSRDAVVDFTFPAAQEYNRLHPEPPAK